MSDGELTEPGVEAIISTLNNYGVGILIVSSVHPYGNLLAAIIGLVLLIVGGITGLEVWEEYSKYPVLGISFRRIWDNL